MRRAMRGKKVHPVAAELRFFTLAPLCVTPGEDVVPIGGKSFSQPDEGRQCGEILARLQTLDIPGAHTNLFGQSFLRLA